MFTMLLILLLAGIVISLIRGVAIAFMVILGGMLIFQFLVVVYPWFEIALIVALLVYMIRRNIRRNCS